MKKFSLIFTLLISLLITGCDVHEFPKLPGNANFVIHLNFDTALPIFKEIEYTKSKSRTENRSEAYDVRHIISVHRLNRSGEYSRTADTTIVFTCDDVVNLNCSQELNLPEGEYNIFVWTDYVNSGSFDDKYYDTSDLAEITIKNGEDYVGSSDYRDTYRGNAQAMVRVLRDEMHPVDNQVTVYMQRPMAKYQFISTDYREFTERILKAEAEKRSRQGSKGDDSKADAEENRTVNPADYRVKFIYASNLPKAYNLFRDWPNAAWGAGIWFESGMRPLVENGITDEIQEVELGFDYIFINGVETSIQVMMEVYHKDGELVASTSIIEVPLKRSKLTILRGSFLTSIADGGVGINPGFNGPDHNYPVSRPSVGRPSIIYHID